MIYERIPVYSGRIKRGGSAASSMDFVSTVLSLSQKHDEGANSGRGKGGRMGDPRGCRKERRYHGMNAVESEGESGAAQGWSRGGCRGGGEGRKRDGKKARRRERAGIRRNKRGIFVPATNPNGEKRTFLFSFTRQPTYPPTFMSAVSED